MADGYLIEKGLQNPKALQFRANVAVDFHAYGDFDYNRFFPCAHFKFSLVVVVVFFNTLHKPNVYEAIRAAIILDRHANANRTGGNIKCSD